MSLLNDHTKWDTMVISSALQLLKKYLSPDATEQKLIVESRELTYLVGKVAKSTMILLHEFGILFGGYGITLISKDDVFTSLMASCKCFGECRYDKIL